MRYLLELSKENLELSKQEALALLEPKTYIFINNYLLLDKLNKRLAKRLAYTKNINKILFNSTEEYLSSDIRKFNWKKVYKKDFCLRSPKTGLDEKKISSIIWKKLKDAKSNLKNPNTLIEIIKINNLFYTTKNIYSNTEDFSSRKPHKKPEMHPSSLDPRLARTMINLTGIKKGSILDAMCGSGGILVEAGLMRLKPIGYDIDQIMLNRAKINLNHYEIRNYRLKLQNALEINKKLDYIITDLPYGLNTKIQDDLHKRFIKLLPGIFKKRAVIGFPSIKNKKIDYKKLIEDNNLKITNLFEIYIHKSLSKLIFVLER